PARRAECRAGPQDLPPRLRAGIGEDRHAGHQRGAPQLRHDQEVLSGDLAPCAPLSTDAAGPAGTGRRPNVPAGMRRGSERRTDMQRRLGTGSVVLALVLAATVAVSLALATDAGAQAKEIKIGGTMAITGNFAVEWGPKAKQFMEEWAALMNERGGVFVKEANAKLPIKLIVYDDGSNPDRAVELYERLATTDKVDFFTGPASSPITIKASTVAEKYGVPMVTAEANSPAIFARGFKWLVGADRPAPQWAEDYYAMVKALMDAGAMPRLKTVAVIQEN